MILFIHHQPNRVVSLYLHHRMNFNLLLANVNFTCCLWYSRRRNFVPCLILIYDKQWNILALGIHADTVVGLHRSSLQSACKAYKRMSNPQIYITFLIVGLASTFQWLSNINLSINCPTNYDSHACLFLKWRIPLCKRSFNRIQIKLYNVGICSSSKYDSLYAAFIFMKGANTSGADCN